MSNTERNGLEIAIIGMSCYFPGARDVEQFWRNLRGGVESICFFDKEELEVAGVRRESLANPNFVRAYGALEKIELFDAAFFGFTAVEAALTDPQHRLFLECVWKALEDAGCDPESYSGYVGVYGGVGMNNYLANIYTNPEVMSAADNLLIAITNDKDFLATRTSYKLNLKGPSITVQTACSTSLVAVHLACQGLLCGACDVALAGGATVAVQQKKGYLYQEGNIGSPDGHCRAFDARAAGTVPGSGVGVVVLKRLEEALAEGDHIYAVIKGSAINNDGSLKVGYTAPSVEGQVRVIKMAQAMAEVEPQTIGYIEAHGTGTELGDPIEVAALDQVFGRSKGGQKTCAIGSVKTNLGHLDTAAGVAGLIKTALALEREELPPSLHFQELNPKIDLRDSPLYVNAELAAWKAGGAARRAGVSSFGIGGTNAHVIVEEAPRVETSGPSRQWQLLTLSAKTASALEEVTANLLSYLRSHLNGRLADVAFSLQTGRTAFEHRKIAVCRDTDDAIKTLESGDRKRVDGRAQQSKDCPVVFMFPGQGAQYVNMGLELYRSEPALREQVDICSEMLKSHLGLDLRQSIYPPAGQEAYASQQLKQTFLTQPALFVIEYALAKQLIKWGVRPQAMIGHSIGEYVAACLAGVLSLEDALRLVAARGRLMQGLPAGAMLAVTMPDSELAPLLTHRLSLAAINAPSLSVVSGPVEEVASLEKVLDRSNVASTRLHTSHAFHSEMMEPILEPFTEVLRAISLNPPEIPYVSNVTGNWITAEEATDPSYWAGQLRKTVRFSEGVRCLLTTPDRALLEVGPGQTLARLVSDCQESDRAQVVLHSMRSANAKGSDVETLIRALGGLWLAGVRIDWSAFYAGERRLRVPLPTYPFERKRFWVEKSRPAGPNAPGNNHKTAPINEPVAEPPAKIAGHPGNGFGEDDSGLEKILEQQIEILTKQLRLMAAKDDF